MAEPSNDGSPNAAQPSFANSSSSTGEASSTPATTSAAVQPQRKRAMVEGKKWDAFWPHICSYLTLTETIYLLRVSKRLNEIARKYWDHKTDFSPTKLRLNEFWYTLGGPSTSEICKQFLPRFQCVRSVDLSYCTLLTNDTLSMVLRSLSNPLEIRSLHLYMCYKLTDPVIEVVAQVLPNLRYLDIGKCIQLTDQAMRYLEGLKDLRRLSVTGLVNLGLESIMCLDAGFESLQSFRITGVVKFTQKALASVTDTRTNIKFITEGERDDYKPQESRTVRRDYGQVNNDLSAPMASIPE